jgi:protein disulfide-isomerase
VKRHFVLLVGLALLGARGLFAADGWETDFAKAQNEAKSQHKLLFINFTGSDWCGYCVRMDRDVLSKPQFKDFANKNLVLLEVDFPRMKEQAQTLRAQNRKLAGDYRVEGFPTFVVLDSDGKTVWTWDGYFPGGADAFVAELAKLRKS